jgi:hypothetical protein
MKEIIMDVDLLIELLGNEASTTLTFTNIDEYTVFFDNNKIQCDDVDHGHCFKIINKTEKRIDYCKIGTTVPWKGDYCIVLGPKATLIVNFLLTHFYQFKKGHKYLVQYISYNQSNLKDEEFTNIESNMVEVVIE